MKPFIWILLIGLSIAISATVGYYAAKRSSSSSCSCTKGEKAPTSSEMSKPSASDPNAVAYQNTNVNAIR